MQYIVTLCGMLLFFKRGTPALDYVSRKKKVYTYIIHMAWLKSLCVPFLRTYLKKRKKQTLEYISSGEDNHRAFYTNR